MNISLYQIWGSTHNHPNDTPSNSFVLLENSDDLNGIYFAAERYRNEGLYQTVMITKAVTIRLSVEDISKD